MRSPLICREGRSITPGVGFAQGTTQSIVGFTGDYQAPHASLPPCGGGWPSRERGSGEGSAASGTVAPLS